MTVQSNSDGDMITCPLCGAQMQMQTASRGRNAGKSFWGCSRFPSCKGSRDADGALPKARKSAEVRAAGASARRKRNNLDAYDRGDLLISRENLLGAGKLIGAEGDELILEYFDTPGQADSDRYRESVPRGSAKPLKLIPELRVFWRDPHENWRSGRILEANEQGDIYVKGHEWEGFLLESKVFVRWDRPLVDPVGFGAAGLLESPLLADLRRPFLQSVLRQRSAAHGMRAVLSSCIELHEHQVQTAWRILQDPVQRYLLADEVGLGKTIEAGIVIRQLLLDDPALTVQLVLPPFLIDQWRRELEEKFRIRDFPSARFHYSRDDRPETWNAAGLLVVDEAHNLARLADIPDAVLADRYTRLAEVATASPRLLMLSATPALHNEQAFLSMLKLLDPAVYGESTVVDLRRRLETRGELGRLLLGLQPGLPRVLLRNRLAEVRATFPDDADVDALTDAALVAVEGGTGEDRLFAIAVLRTHISEVYRVHRRMLRTRRTKALEGSYRVTGRFRPESLALQSATYVEITRLLDEWRQAALAASEHDGPARAIAAGAFATAVSLSLDPDGMRDWARLQTAVSTDERGALERIENTLSYLDRRTTITRPLADALTYLFSSNERMVVFCPSTEMATEIAAEMRELINERDVIQHLATDDPGSTDIAVRAFEESGPARVLVADASAEEGRNFQFADVLIHVGLPSDANRLEQRIGRCDRWNVRGDEAGWRSHWVRETGDDASFSAAWFRILEEGFGVFDGSVASLQHAVDEATAAAWDLLLVRGVDAATDAITLVQQRLADEVERVREQDALDSIESSTDERSLFNRMVSVEAEASEFANLTDALLSARRTPGNLRFEPVGNPVQGVGSYEVFGRLPGHQAQIPLVPGWRLLRDFLPLRGHVGTFQRTIAIERGDIHLYRYGDQFIDAVSDFLSNDDRGRAFGMWRWLPDWTREERPIYRFDYAVEANPMEVTHWDDKASPLAARHLAHGLDRLSVSKRADGIFAPMIVSLWVDEHGSLLEDLRQIEAVRSPYAKPVPGVQGGDYALNHNRIERAYELVPATIWQERWRAAEKAAQEHVRSDQAVSTAVDRALAVAENEASIRLNQLRLRSARTAGAEHAMLEQEIELELIVANVLENCIRTPTLRLDSTGIIVVSGDGLEPTGTT